MTRSLFAAAFVAIVFTRFASAQSECGKWSALFADATPPHVSGSLAVLDSGGGPNLYSSVPGRGVLHWTGSVWELSQPLASPSNAAGVFRSARDGSTPVLLFQERLSGGGLDRIWRFDGTTWTATATCPAGFGVRDVDYFDDGGGPALCVAGVDGLNAGSVLRWNGATWSLFGAPLPALGGPNSSIGTLAVFDVGGTPRLHIAGVPNVFGTSSVGFWNGSAWTPVAGLNELVWTLRTLDTGATQRLCAGLPNATSDALRVFDGTTWTSPAASLRYVRELEPVDLGAGERMLVCGSNGTAATFQQFDGTLLAPAVGLTSTPFGWPAPNTSGQVRSTAAWFDGTDAHVFALGQFTTAGGVGSNGLAEWDGSAWKAFGRGLFPNSEQSGIVRVLGSFEFGGGVRSLVAGGNFDGGGNSPISPFRSLGHWTGTDWFPIGAGVGASNYSFPRAIATVDFGAGPELFVGGRWMQGVVQRGLVRWTGSTWTHVPEATADIEALLAFDDGSGPRLAVAGYSVPLSGPTSTVLFAYDGANATPIGGGVNGSVSEFAIYQGRLVATGHFSTAGGTPARNIASWDGTSWSPLGTGVGLGVNDAAAALCTFGGELYVGGSLGEAGGGSVSGLARWNGTSWSDVPGGGIVGYGEVLALQVHDDGRGPALYVGGAFTNIGGITARDLARFDGTAWEEVDGGVNDAGNQGGVYALGSLDDDGDGDNELFAAGRFTQAGDVSSGNIARLEGCPHYASFCAGDGSFTDHTTPCPCGNNGAAGRGCANSANANGALLAASGSTQLDTVVLDASGMPASAFGLYLQHDTAGDSTFQDGVLCAGGTLTRLRGRTSAGGASQFPDATFAQDATLTLSQRGGVTPGSGATRYYSTFYRNASTTFCPPATANVTNGVRVIW
jgi:hypothetical protein